MTPNHPSVKAEFPLHNIISNENGNFHTIRAWTGQYAFQRVCPGLMMSWSFRREFPRDVTHYMRTYFQNIYPDVNNGILINFKG